MARSNLCRWTKGQTDGRMDVRLVLEKPGKLLEGTESAH